MLWFSVRVRAGPPISSSIHLAVAERIWPELPDHRLNTPAAHIGHEFHHHNAQADAEAAGRMLLAMMKRVNAKTPSELLVVRRS